MSGEVTRANIENKQMKERLKLMSELAEQIDLCYRHFTLSNEELRSELNGIDYIKEVPMK